ncbi:hypothetical protein ACX0G7_23690 [Flavitalea antarctica]
MAECADSVHLRIWFVYELSSTGQLLDIRMSSGEWNADLITYSSNTLYSDTLKMSIKARKSGLRPKSGWELFPRWLHRLRDNGNIPEMPGGADGVTYCFEVADPSSYQFFTKWTPEISAQSDIASKEVAEFLAKMEYEFDFQRLYVE